MHRALVLALTAICGGTVATLILVLSGLLPVATPGAAQEAPPTPQARAEPPAQPQWSVVAGEGRVLRINQLTGEAFVLRPYLGGKRNYWEPVDDDVFMRARMINTLRELYFSPAQVESMQRPGGEWVLRLNENYKDLGFGLLPGDQISTVRQRQNFRNVSEFLNALYEMPSDRGGVHVSVWRGDAKVFLRVWLPLVQLEP